MNYYGAEDYYYWQGVEQGQTTPGSDLGELLVDLVATKGSMAMKCREAYVWGFYWGLELDV